MESQGSPIFFKRRIKKERKNMAVMARPSRRPSFVSKGEIEKMKNNKRQNEAWKEIKKMAQEFDKKNLNR